AQGRRKLRHRCELRVGLDHAAGSLAGAIAGEHDHPQAASAGGRVGVRRTGPVPGARDGYDGDRLDLDDGDRAGAIAVAIPGTELLELARALTEPDALPLTRAVSAGSRFRDALPPIIAACCGCSPRANRMGKPWSE